MHSAKRRWAALAAIALSAGIALSVTPAAADTVSGPCAGRSTCTFDTRTFVQLGGDLVESITAYGQYWNFLGDQPWAPAPNGYLIEVGRYLGGPCASQSWACTLDTRTFVQIGGDLIESITADGQYWNFVGDQPWAPAPHGYLSDVGRYAGGPCAGQATCAMDSRTFVQLGGDLVESITANGQYWNFVGDSPWGGGPHDALTDVARYQATASSAQQDDLVRYAVQQATNHLVYAWDGGNQDGPTYGTCCNSPSHKDYRNAFGFDCSGLTMYAVYQATGILLQHYTGSQYDDSRGTKIPVDRAQPGDLLFWASTTDDRDAGRASDHVAIVVGDGKIMEASPSGVDVHARYGDGRGYFLMPSAVRFWH